MMDLSFKDYTGCSHKRKVWALVLAPFFENGFRDSLSVLGLL
jgi:hypothetical protein